MKKTSGPSTTPTRLSGFTLVELIVVVAIIGVIASIAIPQYFSYIAKARITLGVSTLQTARTDLEAYYTENDSYPATIDFATGLDGFGQRVFPVMLTNDLKHDLFSIDSYVPTAVGYTILARAIDDNHTTLTMTPSKISY